jgi:hypothetical protein
MILKPRRYAIWNCPTSFWRMTSSIFIAIAWV